VSAVAITMARHFDEPTCPRTLGRKPFHTVGGPMILFGEQVVARVGALGLDESAFEAFYFLCETCGFILPVTQIKKVQS
jgi:hypothetical protein